ncbi:ABC transporter ATP-binding protein [Frondihabitans australicus]|uniref:Peptide/nickel transport system ATP-binding protein n=1 Tax=Frondihabitans australicus TaxID=386892 RepID=A0A495IDZ5_9MICO|nr:ABC transporter ATP-binding protein [Frondihabitans australicus]RKR73561.1 peptide/nickel transport system ATP-binding protein [Frondihabitans australicus]
MTTTLETTGAPAPTADDRLLDVRGLTVVYDTSGASGASASDASDAFRAVDDVSFTLRRGEFIGLVGESGSGKSTLGFALTRLAKPPARIAAGSIFFDGTDVATIEGEQLREQRHGGFAMVLQSGMNALNPVRTIRDHFRDIYRAHRHVPRERWESRSVELVGKVELPGTVLDRYPGELSGGMRQRVSIALALSLEPQLLVFDEPTTALDVLVQHAVMETITQLQRSEGFTAILISHDLGIVLEATERVLVMHEGRIVEDAPSREVLTAPKDEYTKMLLGHYADPRAETIELPGFEHRAVQPTTSTGSRASVNRVATKTLVVDSIGMVYPPPRRGESAVTAVDGVSFTLEPGEALALVGASGSGKSTIAKIITAVERPTSGTVAFGDLRIDRLSRRSRAQRELHRDIQMVFQDPYAALNPLHTVEYTLMRPVLNYTGLRGREARRRMLELLETVGLTPVEQFAQKLPHQLSGGQRQRVVIARALASDPQVIIADEPVSMLDVSLRAGVLALLDDLRVERGVSMLYITHDLLSARVVTDNILVLNQGRVVERGETSAVLRNPTDDYTIRLLDAIPNPARDGVA